MGLRSAVLRVKHRETPMQFLVFPMTHMAQADFYRDVTRMLRDTDVIVAEGVKGRSALGSTLTATYRILARRPGINLVQQSIGYEKLGKPVINPDVTSAEFVTAWRKAPLRHRVRPLDLADHHRPHPIPPRPPPHRRPPPTLGKTRRTRPAHSRPRPPRVQEPPPETHPTRRRTQTLQTRARTTARITQPPPRTRRRRGKNRQTRRYPHRTNTQRVKRQA